MKQLYLLLFISLYIINLNAQTGQAVISSSPVNDDNPALIQALLDSANQVWVSRYNGPGNDWDEALAIAVDETGNVYVTGGSSPGSGLPFDYATKKYNSSGEQEWAARYNGTGNGGDEARAIAVDDSGNVFVSGWSAGINGYNDYATVKYNASGTEVWSARFNGSANSDDGVTSIAVDNLGNVYVTGYSTGMTSDYDYVTVKYNASGAEEWNAVYNGPGNFIDYACSIVVDDSGNVVVSGWSAGITGYNDYATVKYNAGGTQKWVARYHGPAAEGDDVCYDLAVDCSGYVYVTGGSNSEAGDRDYATVKYNPSGTEEWVARFNGLADDFDVAQALAVDCSGNVYVTGKSAGANTSLDYLTVKYNSSGEEVWTSLYNGPGNSEDGASAIAIDNSGNIYVTGISTGLNSGFDYATIKYNPSGTEEWVSNFNGADNGDDWCSGIALDASGNVYVTGYSFDLGTSYDYATIKYEQIPVPVKLISFNAVSHGSDVILSWATSTETNNKGFDIERSAKGADRFDESLTGKWERIGFVEGNGTTSLNHSYSYIDNKVAPGKYIYRLKQMDFEGSYEYSKEVEVNVTAPMEFSLGQNYPNPFNPSTTITYQIPQKSFVSIKVFDVLGSEVETLVNGEKEPGSYEVKFNASHLSSGIYSYKLMTGSFVEIKKMIVMK